jgi:hypothetical protein
VEYTLISLAYLLRKRDVYGVLPRLSADNLKANSLDQDTYRDLAKKGSQHFP